MQCKYSLVLLDSIQITKFHCSTDSSLGFSTAQDNKFIPMFR